MRQNATFTMAPITSRLLVCMIVCALGPYVGSQAHGGEGCPCPCPIGGCVWNPVTDQPCMQAISYGDCKCTGVNLCTLDSYRLDPMNPPESTEVLYTGGSPPPGDCCITGCGGSCFAWEERVCRLGHLCLNQSGQIYCGQGQVCNFYRYDWVTTEGSWRVSEECCIDVQ